MKKIELNKKLIINKVSIAQLDEFQLNVVKGGKGGDGPPESYTCPPTYGCYKTFFCNDY